MANHAISDSSSFLPVSDSAHEGAKRRAVVLTLRL